MGAIASLSLNLETNLKGWNSGLKSATNSVDKFYGSVGAKIASAASPVTSVIKGVAGLGTAFKGLVASAVAPLGKVAGGISGLASGAVSALGPIAGVAGGVALAIGGIALAVATTAGAMTSAGLDRIDALADASQRLGVTTEALSELRYAANLTGSSADDLDGALEKLSANLGDSATKATPTSDALKRLGLDAKQLANGNPADAFKAIVGGFEKIPNSSEKASLAMDIFGKGGIKILNTLGSGKGELDRLATEAQKFGVSVSQVDAAKIGVAKDSLDRAGAAIEGIGNSLAIELAPLIEVAANAFTQWFGSTVEGAGGVKSAIGGIVKVVGWVADAAWSAEKSLQEAFAGIIESASSVVESLGLSVTGTTRDIADTMRADIARGFDRPPSEKLTKFLDDVKAKSLASATATADGIKSTLGAATAQDGLGKSIEDVTKKLKEQADTFGMTAAEAEVFKLAQMGATEAQIADAKASAERLKGLEKAKKENDELKDFAKGLKENAQTAGQKLESELGKIQKAKDAGFLDGATAGQAAAKAGKDSGLTETKFAGAAKLGSAEAYSSITSALSGRGDGMADLSKSSTTTAGNTTRLVALFDGLTKTLGRPQPQLNI